MRHTRVFTKKWVALTWIETMIGSSIAPIYQGALKIHVQKLSEDLIPSLSLKLKLLRILLRQRKMSSKESSFSMLMGICSSILSAPMASTIRDSWPNSQIKLAFTEKYGKITICLTETSKAMQWKPYLTLYQAMQLIGYSVSKEFLQPPLSLALWTHRLWTSLYLIGQQFLKFSILIHLGCCRHSENLHRKLDSLITILFIPCKHQRRLRLNSKYWIRALMISMDLIFLCNSHLLSAVPIRSLK